jgi:hypothetical protein
MATWRNVLRQSSMTKLHLGQTTAVQFMFSITVWKGHRKVKTALYAGVVGWWEWSFPLLFANSVVFIVTQWLNESYSIQAEYPLYKRLGTTVSWIWDFFFSLEYFLGIESKFQCKIHLCFMCTLYTQPEVILHNIFSTSVFWLYLSWEVRCRIFHL